MARSRLAALAVVVGVLLIVSVAEAAERPMFTGAPGAPARMLGPAGRTPSFFPGTRFGVAQGAPFASAGARMGAPGRRGPFVSPESRGGIRPGFRNEEEERERDRDRDHRFSFRDRDDRFFFHDRDHRFFFRDRHHRSFLFFGFPSFYYPYYPYYYSYPYGGTYSYSPYSYYNYYGNPPSYSSPAPGYKAQPPAPSEEQPYEAAPGEHPSPPAEDRAFNSRLSPMLGEPGPVGTAFALGEAKLKAGDYTDAVTAFQRARDAAPGDPAPQIALALALEGVQRYEGAAYMLRNGLKAIEDWGAVHPDLQVAFGGADRYAAAAGRLMDADRKAPDSHDLQLLVAFHYFGTSHYAKAATILAPLQQAAPTDAAVKALLRAAEHRLGEEAPPAERTQL